MNSEFISKTNLVIPFQSFKLLRGTKNTRISFIKFRVGILLNRTTRCYKIKIHSQSNLQDKTIV